VYIIYFLTDLLSNVGGRGLKKSGIVEFFQEEYCTPPMYLSGRHARCRSL